MDATLQDPLIGQVIDGRYRVQSRIAVGGMATVYRALDTRLDRTLALKVMHPSLSTDSGFVERFIREAKSVARLDHPNVVGVTDQGTDGDYVYLAMELVEGCTLRDLAREGALAPRAVLDLMEPVAAGLAAAHRAGLVHRDVKPENVLIGRDGRVKVADFGLVRGVDTQTSAHTDSLLGTASYLAPEQIDSGTVGPATDVYACGIMLYELLTGAKPHAGDSAAQVLIAHVNRDVPAPSERVAGTPQALDALVARAAARDLGTRPSDAAELLSALRAARSALTDAELDAGPPVPATGAAAVAAAAVGAVGDSGEEGPSGLQSAATAPAAQDTEAPPVEDEDVTQVVPRPAPAAEPAGTERTALIDLPRQEEAADPPRGGLGERLGLPARPLPRRTVYSLVAGVVLLLGLATGVWYISSGQFTQTPGVYDVPQAEAEQTLRDAGLRVRVVEEFSPNVQAGHVVTTDPERGERVRRNGEVTLTVSRGPEIVAVPDLVGVPLDEAREQLAEAGLTPGDVEREFSQTVERGQILATDPEAGTEVRPDAPVELTLSRGAEIPVPDVVGATEAAAVDALVEAGFEVEVAEEPVYSEEPSGRVAEVSPGAGASAGEGETVTVTLSKGPEMVVVPDVRSMSEEDAREELEDAGFEVRVQRFFLTGTVFNQSVHSGDSAPKGSEITIYVR